MLQFIMEKAHDEHLEELFKNISCYSLSASSRLFVHPIALFKNISCYSLSAPLLPISETQLNLKTSHVTVYQ